MAVFGCCEQHVLLAGWIALKQLGHLHLECCVVPDSSVYLAAMQHSRPGVHFIAVD